MTAFEDEEHIGLQARPLGAAFDLLAAFDPEVGFFFEREGLGLSTSGGSFLATEPTDDLHRLARETLDRLRALGSSSPGAPGAVAVGALPFSPGLAELAVPVRAVRRTDEGETWLVEVVDVGTSPPFLPQRVRSDLPHDAFRPVQLQEVPTGPRYAEAVAEAVRRIQDGVASKIVLSRTVRVRAGRSLDARRLLHRLRVTEPHAYTFAAPLASGQLLAGASPELLASRRGRSIASVPLAGSASRSGDPDEDRSNAEALQASSKNREEHAIVVEAVAEVLGDLCERLTFDPEPVLLPTANVWHLATRFRGVLADPETNVLDVVARLHPTPAVCGTPTSVARSVIAEMEPFDRGAYAGPVGWMDAKGDGEWAIALRCAQLEGDHATLFAGAGIVAASEPEQELEETDRKFRAFLDSLRWG